MRLKDLKLKKGETLRIGYFNNNGQECIIANKYQILTGWAFDKIKENYDTEVYKVKYGYATKFIAERLLENERVR